jgi:hypothetical protein
LFYDYTWEPWINSKMPDFPPDSKILVGNQMDLYHPSIDPKKIIEVNSQMKENKNLKFIVGTQYPERVFSVGTKWLGLKVNTQKRLDEKIIFYNEIDVDHKFLWLYSFSEEINLNNIFLCKNERHYILFGREAPSPIYPCPHCHGHGFINNYNLEWIIISGDSNKKGIKFVIDWCLQMDLPLYEENSIKDSFLDIYPKNLLHNK